MKGKTMAGKNYTYQETKEIIEIYEGQQKLDEVAKLQSLTNAQRKRAESDKKRHKKWYENNKEHAKAKRKENYEKHKDAYNAKHKEWCDKNREYVNAAQRMRYYKNIDKRKEYYDRYYQEHKEEIKAKRRAKKQMLNKEENNG